MEWLTQLTKLTEIKARYFFISWLFGALLIFLPEELKQLMAITIPETIRPWVGFATLAAFVMWIVLVALQIFTYFRKKANEKSLKEATLGQLETLSQGERDIFLICLSNNQKTIQRNITDGPANSLKSKRLLVMASQGSILSMPHTIPKFVWDYIKENEEELFPELFDENSMTALKRRLQNSWMR